jgi:hypothetical protein
LREVVSEVCLDVTRLLDGDRGVAGCAICAPGVGLFGVLGKLAVPRRGCTTGHCSLYLALEGVHRVGLLVLGISRCLAMADEWAL